MNLLSRGLFITVEGIDGSGKTTFAKKLHQHFANQNFPAILTKEPSETAIGQQIRAFLQKKIQITDKAQYLFFAADRAQHFHDVIIPSLDSRKIVISDRCGDSSLAYQGYARGLDLRMIKEVNKWAMNGIEPDLVFYLKIDPRTALDRVTKRNEGISEFENLLLMQKIAYGFDEIFSNRSNVIIIDALQSSEDMLDQAIKVIDLRIK